MQLISRGCVRREPVRTDARDPGQLVEIDTEDLAGARVPDRRPEMCQAGLVEGRGLDALVSKLQRLGNWLLRSVSSWRTVGESRPW